MFVTTAIYHGLTMKVFNIYIDEAGDEGFVFNQQAPLGSSRWFIIAGIIVRQEDDLEVSHCIDRVRQRLGWGIDVHRAA